MQEKMSLINWLHYASISLLFYTKYLDVYSTIHHVGPNAEMNPIVRKLFRSCGFYPGLAVACLIYVIVVCVQNFVVVTYFSSGAKMVYTFGALVVSATQYEVARFNTTKVHSWITGKIHFVYSRWLMAAEKRKNI